MAKGIGLTVDIEVNAKSKPGHKTSEFWGAVVIHVLAIALIGIGLYHGKDGIVQVGMLMLAGVQGTYSLGRSLEKSFLNNGAAVMADRIGKLPVETTPEGFVKVPPDYETAPEGGVK